MPKNGIMKINNNLEHCKVSERQSLSAKQVSYFIVDITKSRSKQKLNKKDYALNLRGNYLADNTYHKLNVNTKISSFIEICSYVSDRSTEKRYKLLSNLKSIIIDNFNVGILERNIYILNDRKEVFLTKDFEAKGISTEKLYGYAIAEVPKIVAKRIEKKFNIFKNRTM